jgi:polysaccharide export outer membrane protein
MLGPPDALESQPAGGAVPTHGPHPYPFELWAYNYVEGLGGAITIEFGDTAGSGEFLEIPDLGNHPRRTLREPVSVIGAVRAPGVYQLGNARSLLDVLAMAQGLDAQAGNVIEVVRSGMTMSIDRDELFSGRAHLNIPILGSDFINVLPARAAPQTAPGSPSSVHVLGRVERPGLYALRPDLRISVLEAIALAGGMRSDGGDIVIIRRPPGREMFRLDRGQLLSGAVRNVMLEAGDVVVVP